MMIRSNSHPHITMEVVTDSDPAEIAAFKACMDRYGRNSDWYQAHLDEIGSDHELRPIIEASVSQADGSWCVAAFLVDSGADRTVLSADVLNRLGVSPV